MTTKKLITITEIVSEKLSENQIPFALIGAMALAAYGLPRYTADIDVLTEFRFRQHVILMMEKSGYSCFQKTGTFAQFDSESGVLGKIDFMFIKSEDGREILNRRILVQNESVDPYPVIQPTDYIILKLMALANNPERIQRDEADIISVLKLYRDHMILEDFEPIDMNRIRYFGEKFRQSDRVKKYENILSGTDIVDNKFQL